MKSFVIDGDFLCQNSMNGMHRYMHEILKRIDLMLCEKDDIRIVIRKGEKIKKLSFKNIKVVNLNASGFSYRLIAIPRYVKKNNAVFVSMSNGYTACKNSIVTIHDLIPLYKESEYSFKSLFHMKSIYWAARRNAKKIITISNNSKNDIINKLNVNPNIITITSCGYEHMLDIVEDENVFEKNKKIKKDDYYLSLGSTYSYKNTKWVCENASYNKNMQYVICGKISKDLEEKYRHLDNIIFTGFVSDGEYKALLKSAKAFIYPSRLEGFGIPPLEAMCLGIKTIVSESSALAEIYDGYVYYINPDKYEIDIDKLIEPNRIAFECGLMNKQNWDVAADQWIKILREYS